MMCSNSLSWVEASPGWIDSSWTMQASFHAPIARANPCCRSHSPSGPHLSTDPVPLPLPLPQGLALYWTFSAGCGLGQNIALRYPRLRRACAIPATPGELARPVRDLMAMAAQNQRAFWAEVHEKNFRAREGTQGGEEETQGVADEGAREERVTGKRPPRD